MPFLRTTTLAFLCTLVGTTAAANAAGPVTIANESLKVTLAIPTGTLAVEDRRCGLVWKQYLPIQSARGPKWGEVRTERVAPGRQIQIESAVVEDRSIRATARWQDFPFTINIELPAERAVLEVTIDTPEPAEQLPWKANWAGVILMTYPYGFYNETVTDTVVPVDEGVAYSPKEIDPLADPRRWNLTALHSKLSMPWWATL